MPVVAASGVQTFSPQSKVLTMIRKQNSATVKTLSLKFNETIITLVLIQVILNQLVISYLIPIGSLESGPWVEVVN